MKEYRFDYIREDVMKWCPEARRTCSLNDLTACASVSPPYFVPGEPYIPSYDKNGDSVENYCEWAAQRDTYCRKLYKEICDNRSWYDNLEAKYGTIVVDLDVLLSYSPKTILSIILISIVDCFKNLKRKLV